MMKRWRPLALAAAIEVTLCIGIATAQTVVVRGALPGSTFEFVLNGTTIGSAAADAAGDATVAVNQATNVGKPEMDAHIYVDLCDKLRRVLVVDRILQPPPESAGCIRTQLVGVFLVRPISTLVVNVAGPNPTVLLRQGSFSLRPPRVRTWSPPTGLVLFGGGGLAKFRDAAALACGDVGECAGGDFGGTYTVGADFWITRYLAAEASYLKPAKANVDGSQNNFRFKSFLDAHVVTAAAKVGIPAGRVRLYGQGGANYHRATSGTTQTIDDVTVTIDGVAQTIKGGTQTYGLRTAGWGWQFGGGVEVWLTSALALHGEAGRVALKGAARDDAEGTMDDGLTFILIGGRVRIGR